MHSAPVDRLGAALAGRYRVLDVAGRGGMATVHVAEDVKHGRKVAIKVIRPELTESIGARRFLREIELLARLTHPNILPLLDSGEAEGQLYYVMPFLEGESLRARLDRERQLPIEEAIRLLEEIADALAYAHDQGIIHRDIKPENILLSAGHAVVSDFGIAHVVRGGGEELTQTGIAIGTPHYMSPEQASGDRLLDPRSDIYSLGCVAYEMLGGEPPFTGATPRVVISRHSMDPVPPLRTLRPTVSAELERAVQTALAKVPTDRYATAKQFASAIRRASNEGGPAVSRGRWRAVTRRPLLVAASLATLVGISAAGSLVARRLSGPAAPVPVGTPEKLTWEQGVESGPTLSADGNWLAYSHDGDIHLRRARASGAANLTRDSRAWDGQPAFSPDGQHLAFASRREGGETVGGIWIMETGGSPARRVTRAGFDPAWSVDGAEILFTTEYTGWGIGRVRTSQLRAVNVSTGVERVVSTGDALTAVWSPGGHRIAYARAFIPGRNGGQRDIWTARGDGSDPVSVTDDGDFDGNPVWSPDGRYLGHGGAHRDHQRDR